MSATCYWCNADGATKTKQTAHPFCGDACKTEFRNANNTLRGTAVIPPAEKEKRRKLLNGARDGDLDCQRVLSEAPYYMTGVFDSKTQSMRRW